jgi:predicted phage terminase large subunit-like protein
VIENSLTIGLRLFRKDLGMNQTGTFRHATRQDKANRPAVTQRLKINVPGVIGISPQGGKTASMFAAAPEWQAGDRYVDRNAAWTEPFVEQITMFPAGRHDDQTDMMSQAAAWQFQSSVVAVP